MKMKEGKQDSSSRVGNNDDVGEPDSSFASLVPSSSQHEGQEQSQDTNKTVIVPPAALSSLSQSSSTGPISKQNGIALSQSPSSVAPLAETTVAASPSSTSTSLRNLTNISDNNTNNNQKRKNPVVMERENFLMFIKILFKVLEEDAAASSIKSRAQRIVMECRRLNRQGDPNFDPMMDAVGRRLRVFVGETKWRKAHLLVHHYKCKRQQQQQHGGGIVAAASAIRRTARPTTTAAC
mmetsp:Transcript_110604/g.155270  ORF Transcript_110604/g.155270 Transcript_110604/m.155270 type:complete len:237 (+) Transcript_110604:41-751(+)